MVEPGDLYVPMPHVQSNQAASALRIAGVACWQPNRAHRRSYRDKCIDEQAAFEVLEWDLADQDMPRAKKKRLVPASVRAPLDQPEPAKSQIWNPPVFVGGGTTVSGSSAPELSLIFDSPSGARTNGRQTRVA